MMLRLRGWQVHFLCGVHIITTQLLIGTRVGRVRVVFCLPIEINLGGLGKYSAPANWPREPLAYVHWYTPPKLSTQDAKTHNMPSVQKAYLRDGLTPTWSIVPLANVRQACQLIPHFGKTPCGDDWTPSNVLDKVDTLLVNNWLSLYTYQTVYKS